MRELRFTLIADGSSDATLMRIIQWSMDDLYPNCINTGVFADFRSLQKPPKNLKDKIRDAHHYYPFDILFVHRDAESTDTKKILDSRVVEVMKQLSDEEKGKTVCVVPVKMMEAWLLFNTEAIKKAAGNRNYNKNINLPSINKIEQEKQPKELLHNLLKEVSGLKGRNLQKFNVNQAVHLVAEYIEDFSQLRNLEAFNKFEEDLKITISNFLGNR